MSQKLNYLISPITTWDEEKELYETKIAIDQRNMPLHYSCWGTTIDISRKRAETLGIILTTVQDI